MPSIRFDSYVSLTQFFGAKCVRYERVRLRLMFKGFKCYYERASCAMQISAMLVSGAISSNNCVCVCVEYSYYIQGHLHAMMKPLVT